MISVILILICLCLTYIICFTFPLDYVVKKTNCRPVPEEAMWTPEKTKLPNITCPETHPMISVSVHHYNLGVCGGYWGYDNPVCSACDEINRITTTKAECDKCPNRYYEGTLGSCVLK